MTTAAPTAVQKATEPRSYAVLELNTFLFHRFLGMADEEVVELVVLPPSPKMVPSVAYATSLADMTRLAREASRIQRGTGVYVVPNKIEAAIAARYPVNCWNRADAGRANDGEIELVRTIYIDCDSDRPRGISATDAEKACAYELLRRVEEFFIDELGDDRALGRGDSGNGYSLFIAVEPFVPTKETGERIEGLLKGLARKFQIDGAKIDCSVFNPARLTPMFGSLKCKGSDTPERPHRPTFFICRPNIRRVPLEVLA
jgi:hypothetical protein